MTKFKENRKTERFEMLMTTKEKHDLEALAKKNGVSSSQIVRVLIREALKEVIS